jgi:hypothetical protein
MISIAIGGAPNGTGSATGAINFADEVDRYSIVLRGGELYEFQANSTSSRDPESEDEILNCGGNLWP